MSSSSVSPNDAAWHTTRGSSRPGDVAAGEHDPPCDERDGRIDGAHERRPADRVTSVAEEPLPGVELLREQPVLGLLDAGQDRDALEGEREDDRADDRRSAVAR